MQSSLDSKIENMSFDRVRLASMNESDRRRKSSQQNQLLEALKRSLYCSTAYQVSLKDLVDTELMGMLNDSSLLGNQILRNELTEKTGGYNQNEDPKVPAEFDLYEFIKHENRNRPVDETDQFLPLLTPRVKKLSKTERQRAIDVYLIKKSNRQKIGHVRYQVRKDLAVNRKRFKGKFIKDKKIDLKKAAQELLKGDIVKEFASLNLHQN